MEGGELDIKEIDNLFIDHLRDLGFADKTGIEVALLKKPFEHHGNQVQLIFLLALEKKRNDEMNLLFQFFNQIVSHKKYMHALLQSEDSDAFIKNLYSFKLLE